MIIDKNCKDINKIEKLIETKNENIEISNFYIDYLTNYYDLIDSNLIKYHGSFYDAMLDIMDLDKEDISEYNDKYHLSNITRLNTNKYLNNPFNKNIKVKKITNSNWRLEYNYYAPYEGFVYKNISVETQMQKEITHLGYFDEKFPYLQVLENNIVWMSITPHEIETMQESIDNAKGNICVYGLGLGYYAYMCSIKEEVKHIDIIENDDRVIELFTTYLLPQFKDKNKISIIKEDAYKYMNHSKKYDYVFIDIYHDEKDGIQTYIEMKKLEKDSIYEYWLEPSILAIFRRYVITLMEETIEGYKEDDYKKEFNDEDKIINALYKTLRDYKITCFNDALELVSDDNLKRICKDIVIL